MQDSNTDKPIKICFPCEYSMRVVGFASPDFESYVKSTVMKHSADFNGKTKIKWSKNKKFQSIYLSIYAISEEQLKLIFEDLKKNKQVQIVL
jgi:putative lipoic acid-binding regulatory protein